MKTVTLCDKPVRVDDDGFVSLTDMWKASGSANRKQPALYLANEQTTSFIKRLDLKLGNPSFKTQKGRYNGGTWAHKYIAYDFAGWIDPDFKIGTYEVLDRFFSGELLAPQQELHDHLLKVKLSEQLGSFHGYGLNQRKHEKRKLEQEEAELLKRFQHQLNLSPKALLSH